jgi:hypothetical protein
VLKKASWKGGDLRAEFEEPFEILRRSNRLNRAKTESDGADKRNFQIWLPSLDAFRTFAAVCPAGMLAGISQPALVTGGLHA